MMKIKIVFGGGSWVTMMDDMQMLEVVKMVEEGEIDGWEYLS